MENYSFVGVPTNMLSMLDNDCFKLLAILIQKDNYWSNKKKLSANGWFWLSKDDMEYDLGLSPKEISLVIEALFRANLIDVESEGYQKGIRKSNRYKINWNMIKQYESEYTITDIKDKGVRIKKCKRGATLTYLKNDKVESV